MKINLELNNNRIVGYTLTPIDITKPVYEINEIPKGLTSGRYGVVNGVIVELGYTQEILLEIEERKKTILRDKRKPLLEAFDKWEKAVLRGREVDSSVVMNWYTSLLDLEESAFDNIPSVVQYYIY